MLRVRVPHIIGETPNSAANNTTHPEQQKWRPHKPEERHIRAHADATRRLCHDPDSGFTLAVETAKRVAVAGPDT
ncbi:hypothetical protein Rwratislav_48164 [Rhodococcus wratislaviensis IFP 2016]|nr:hypothetical protein Rwratislav_48164 [Rhodococcus wratislaviensis IFP 2016]